MGVRMLETPTVDFVTEWTPEVDLILSALDVGRSNPVERRARPRSEYRVLAELCLFGAPSDVTPPLLFVRDIDPNGMGFITQHPLPLGYNGKVRVEAPDGELLEASCNVYRCRPCSGDWYEGALSFTKPQPVFDID